MTSNPQILSANELELAKEFLYSITHVREQDESAPVNGLTFGKLVKLLAWYKQQRCEENSDA